jgi:hypothetical protein
MAAVAGARAFQDGGHIKPPARFEKRGRILLPIFVVEVRRQKETSLVLQHGIDTHDKIQAPGVPARKMPADHFVGDLKEAAIGAIRAFDSRFFTDATNPFIGAGGRVAGFPGLSALETAGINILPAPEQRSKQLYLGSRRRMAFVTVFRGESCLGLIMARRCITFCLAKVRKQASGETCRMKCNMLRFNRLAG